MDEINQSIIEIEEMFRVLICKILNIDEGDNGRRIRFVWGSNLDSFGMSAPNLKTDQDICYIEIVPYDDAYNRQRDIRYLQNENSENMIAVDEHTDVYQVKFVNYGVNAYDNARLIRNKIHHDHIRRFLRINNWALITNVPAIRRVPELVSGDWVNRADVVVNFNCFVRLIGEMGTIEKIGVTMVQENGNTIDFETDRNFEPRF